MTQKEKLLTAAILSVWMIYLLFQPGHPNDEAEHLHIAWLIQVHGLKPISDFFEHHQPAIWHLIGSLFRIGVNDDWLLFFGRIYVVVAALLSAIGLYLIGCRSTGVTAKSLLIPVFYLMLSSLFLKNLMVIRPETFAAPCIIYCVLLWRASFSATQTNARLLSAGAGLLGIAAVMISPRFAILAPGIPLLFPSHLTVSTFQVIYRATWGLLGSAVGFFLSLNFFNQSLADLTFNVEFSALLQTTGVGFYAGFPIILFVGVFSLLLFVVYLSNSQYSNSVKKVYLAIFIFIYLISIYFSGKYFYNQSIFPFVVWVALFMASTPLMSGGTQQTTLWTTSVAFTTVAAVLSTYQISMLGFNSINRSNTTRALMRKIVPEDQSVLLPYTIHPITRLDPGYYALPILEGNNRLCNTIEIFDASAALPPCDYHETLRHYRPALVAMRFIPKSDDDRNYAQFISINYRYNPDLGVLIRHDIKIPEDLTTEATPVENL